MKFYLAVGIAQTYPRGFKVNAEELFEKKLKKKRYWTGRCDIVHGIVLARYCFEGVLEHHNYVPVCVQEILKIAKDTGRLDYLEIAADHSFGGRARSFSISYEVLGETLTFMPFESLTILFWMRNKANACNTQDIAEAFQRYAEWFSIQAMIAKILDQARVALVKHHRYADAATNIAQATEISLKALRLPPQFPVVAF
jgi:hypothetical protein